MARSIFNFLNERSYWKPNSFSKQTVNMHMISIWKIFQIQSPPNKFTINITCSRPHCSPIYSQPLNRQVDYTLCLFSLAPNWTKKPGCIYIYNFGVGQKKLCPYMYNFRAGQKKPGCMCTPGNP